MSRLHRSCVRRAALAAVPLLALACRGEGAAPWAFQPITHDATFPARSATGNVITEGRIVAAAALDRGRMDYVHFCSSCHGLDGDGKGRSSEGLDPPPRDFRTAHVKFAAVRSGELPNDDDLLRMVRDGLHGTSMPPWNLPEDRLRNIVDFLKTFPPPPCDPAREGSEACSRPRTSRWMQVYSSGKNAGRPKPTGEPIVAEGDPWGEQKTEALEQGARIYHLKAQCWSCHPSYLSAEDLGRMAKEAGEEPPARPRLHEPTVIAAKDNPYGADIRAPDFTRDALRSIRRGHGLNDTYRVIAAGVGGVMPAWIDALPKAELWALAHYVERLSALRQPGKEKELAALRARLGLPSEGTAKESP